MRTAIALLIVGLAWAALAVEVRAHPTGLQLARGAKAAVESGPHGGGVIDVGPGHFELARAADGALTLYQLDEKLRTVPAGEVQSVHLYILGAADHATEIPMLSTREGNGPVHFYVNSPAGAGGDDGYLAIVSISTGKESFNLRYQVAGLTRR